MRTLAVVVVPWLVWGVLDSGIYMALGGMAPERFPPGGAPESTGAILVVLLLRIGYSFVAGYVAGRIAGGPGGAVTAAIGLLLVTGILVQAVNWSLGPAWYHIVFLLSIVPAAVAGARRAWPATG